MICEEYEIKMNILKGSALGLALVVGSASSAAAIGLYRPNLNQVLEGGKEFVGPVTNVERVNNKGGIGERTYFDAQIDGQTPKYAVDPDYDLAKKYDLGNRVGPGPFPQFLVHTEKVVIDGTHLKTGRIKNISPYNATVVLDNGDLDFLYLDDVRRKYITVGDRVVITPCTKWFITYDYQLRPADARPVWEAEIVWPEIAPPAPPPVAPPPPPPAAPVPALW